MVLKLKLITKSEFSSDENEEGYEQVYLLNLFPSPKTVTDVVGESPFTFTPCPHPLSVLPSESVSEPAQIITGGKKRHE